MGRAKKPNFCEPVFGLGSGGLPSVPGALPEPPRALSDTGRNVVADWSKMRPTQKIGTDSDTHKLDTLMWRIDCVS